MEGSPSGTLICWCTSMHYVQSLAIKLAVSISVIGKLAVVLIPVEIQKFA